ncbi:T9SS type A sorting domain-containing protein [bacterium]|nr:T9SS type A sorting domain-containing protein [bacterium]MBU1984038.1 T9SS type A sorting domain-containing protein [bacterium]
MKMRVCILSVTFLFFGAGTAWGQPEWEHVGLHNTDVSFLVPHPTQSNVLFAKTGSFGNETLLRSSDYAESWTQVIPPGAGFLPIQMSFHPSAPDTVVVSGRRTYWWSTDAGNNWVQRETNLLFPGSATIMAAYLPATPGVVFLVAADMDLFWNIYRSENGGATFEETDERPTWAAMNLMTFVSHPSEIIILPYGPSSTDGGETWRALDSDTIVSEFWDIAVSTISSTPIFAVRQQLEGPHAFEPYLVKRLADSARWDSVLHLQRYMSDCAVHPLDGEVVVVSDSNASCLRVSADGGATWTSDPDPVISHLWIRDIQFSSDGRYLYLAAGSSESGYRGVWRREYSASVGELPEAPSSFSVTVYPNPFNSMAVISIRLERPADVDLTIHDVTGRRVTALHRGWLAAGIHTKTWTPQRVSSGVFFAFLQTDRESAVQRVVFLR